MARNASMKFVGLVAFFLAGAGLTTSARAVCNPTDPTWANRDDDGDGVCNGVDDCPYEYDPAQKVADGGTGGAACQMQAITVPWVPTNVSVPHLTYNGRTITFKGIARYGGTQFMWNFGDGSSTAWANISDAYNLSATHAYSNASVNQLYVATLSVRDASGNIAAAIYPVQIYTSSDVTDPNQMDVRIAVAEDEALWNVHIRESRSQYADSSPGWNQRYGYWPDEAATCASLDALQLHGSKPLQPYGTDPYVEDSQRALNYVLAQTTTIPIFAQGDGGVNNPDVSGDGYGVVFVPGETANGGNEGTYIDGICSLAVASSGAPGRVAMTGPANVFNRTYAAIDQDVIDFFAFGQGDGTGSYAGGWLYNANSSSADGSTTQWPILAMVAGESNMHATVPAFVRTELPYFLNYVHNLSTTSCPSTASTNDACYYGSYGYTSASMWPNVAKTAGGILGRFFMGFGNTDTDIEAGFGSIYNRWNVPTNSWTDYNLGNSYAMYDVMKATQTANPKVTRIFQFQLPANNASTSTAGGTVTGNSFDWYYTPSGQTQQGAATNIVGRQLSDGSIPDVSGQANSTSSYLATAWNTLILMKAVAQVPPKAVICNCSAQWPKGQPVTLDGSCSVEPDQSRAILNPTGYKWDYAYDGAHFVQSTDSNNLAVQGPIVTKPDGFPNYTEDANGVLNSTVYTVALQVTDNTPVSQGGPQSSITTCNVIIKPPPHCPQAVIGGPYIGFLNSPVQLDASASSQVDGDMLTYAWDFENANVYGDSTAARPTHSWTANGTYPIELQVTNHPTDPQIPSCTVSAYTTVTVGTHAPVASAGGPYTATPGETVTLDGTASYDPDGNAITYAWDLTGNGTYTDSTSSQPSYTVPAGTAVGTSFSICLRVSDVNKTSTPACSTITTIAHHTAPNCVVAPLAVQNCSGGFSQIALDGTHSNDPNGDHFTYAWTTSDCPAFDNASSSQPKITFQTLQGGKFWEPAAVGASCMPACTATLTVTNAYGSNSCSQQVKFTDSQTPAFSQVPANTTIECNANAAANVNAWLVSAAAGDLCTPTSSPTSVTNNFRGVAGACGGVGSSGGTGGTTTVTFTATDPCNSNSVQGTASLTVSDTQPPVLTLPSSITKEATSAAGALVIFSATALDAATGVTAVTCSPASNSVFALGVTSVTCSSTDVGGHRATGSFNVTVQDTTAPALSLPGNLTVEATSASGATVTWSASASDAVSGSTAVTCTPAAGSTFAMGTTTVSCSTQDAAGNSSSGSFTVAVRDTTAPALSAQANISLEATSSAGAIGTFTVTARDAVSGNTAVTCAPASGSTFAIGTTTVACSSKDAANNTSNSSFTVTVNDSTPPVVTTPANQTIEASSPGGAVFTFSPTSSDKVDGTADAVSCSPASGSTFAIATTTVTCSARDAHNNSASSSFTVTVRDTTPPALSLPASFAAEATSANGATVLFNATANDLVSGSTQVTCTPASGALFPMGSTMVTCATQDAKGNKANGSFTVTVHDTSAPVISVPANQQLEATSAAGAPFIFSASANDAVSGNTSVLCVPASGTIFPFGTTQVTCSSSDGNDNFGSKSFTVTVHDTTAPVINAPADFVVEATSAAGAIATYAVSASDAVSGSTSVTCAPASGSQFPLGRSSVSCTSTDGAGNVATTVFHITVGDDSAPVLTGVVGGTMFVEATGPSGASVVDYGISSTDVVDGALPVTCSPQLPMQFPLGNTPVTCSVTDSHGNTGHLSFSLDVVDTTPPAVSCPANIVVEANGPLGASDWNVSEPTSSALEAFLAQSSAIDQVDPAPALTNNAPLVFPTGGTTQVTFTATDAAGNAGTCTSTVTVYGQSDAAPTLSCPAGLSVAQLSGTELDWSGVFRHSVSTELVVISNGQGASPLSLAESGDRTVQISSAPFASGNFGVRVRATDMDTGASIDCNEFISVNPGFVDAKAKKVARTSVPAAAIRQ